jgi:hypothetical protein
VPLKDIHPNFTTLRLTADKMNTAGQEETVRGRGRSGEEEEGQGTEQVREGQQEKQAQGQGSERRELTLCFVLYQIAAIYCMNLY